MDFTINCTRVPIPQGTTLYGTPVDIGPAPAFPGVVSDHNAPNASNDGNTLNVKCRKMCFFANFFEDLHSSEKCFCYKFPVYMMLETLKIPKMSFFLKCPS